MKLYHSRLSNLNHGDASKYCKRIDRLANCDICSYRSLIWVSKRCLPQKKTATNCKQRRSFERRLLKLRLNFRFATMSISTGDGTILRSATLGWHKPVLTSLIRPSVKVYQIIWHARARHRICIRACKVWISVVNEIAENWQQLTGSSAVRLIVSEPTLLIDTKSMMPNAFFLERQSEKLQLYTANWLESRLS